MLRPTPQRRSSILLLLLLLVMTLPETFLRPPWPSTRDVRCGPLRGASRLMQRWGRDVDSTEIFGQTPLFARADIHDVSEHQETPCFVGHNAHVHNHGFHLATHSLATCALHYYSY